MSKSTPSLLALLGLVAVAGYQNRGRISEMLADARQDAPASGPSGQPSTEGGGFLSEIAGMFGAGASGATLSGGLGDLVAKFKEAGRGAPADS